jgi:hypothetical protein
MRKLVMTKLVMILALLALVASPAAIAQTGNRAGSASSSSQKEMPWPAPVGHRQPRIDEVPPEKNLNDPNNPVNREDAALDRSIKSICRGC